MDVRIAPTPAGQDYTPFPQASMLAGMMNFDLDLRRELLASWSEREGQAALIEAFAQFIGLANSVVQNSHDFLEIMAIIHGDVTPYETEKINFPTTFGALMGVKLVEFGCEQACAGCAFRLGSAANQSPCTTADADWCGHPGEQAFMCHEDMDEKGEPTKICQGWVRLRQSRKRQAA
jgi:hypothetical protein